MAAEATAQTIVRAKLVILCDVNDLVDEWKY